MEGPASDAFFADDDYQFVRFEQTDLHGLSRSKTVPVDRFQGYVESGLNFFGGLLGLDLQSGVAAGTGYMDERNFADTLVRPDLATLAAVPWAPGTARVLCRPYWYDGTAVQGAPRTVLQRLLDEVTAAGFDLLSGFEYEFYLVHAETRAPVFDGIQIFWTLRNNFDQGFVDSLLLNLAGAGIPVATSNAEYGPGQMEITYAPAMGIEAADAAFTFKNAVKEMAQADGYLASFMTKPYGDASANGGHFHLSLLDRKTGANAFHDPAAPDGLSTLCHQWIAGQIEHAAALTAFAAPTINCAKRYKLFSFAPMNATWGYEDRTAAIRIKGGRAGDTHIENRLPCAAGNPYLVAAAILAAGLDGVRRNLVPPDPTERIAYLDETAPPLPRTLDEALAALESDAVLRSALGEELITLFTAVKRHEIEKARAAIPEYGSAGWPDLVTDWERDNLFEYL